MSQPSLPHAFRKELRKIVEGEGAEFIDVLPDKKHAHIRIRHRGHILKIFVARTPSDRRAWLNMRAHVRRVMREAESCTPSV